MTTMNLQIQQPTLPQVFLMHRLITLFCVLLSGEDHLEELGRKYPPCPKFLVWDSPKSYVVGNIVNGEIGEGGGIIQAATGGSGLAE